APASARARAPVRSARLETSRKTPSSAWRSNLPEPHSLASSDPCIYISAAMDRDQLLRELTEFLRIPSISTLPAHNQDCRGAADDKGQVFCLRQAIAASRRPAVNFRFLIEGEEEYGSKVLFDLLKREPQRVRADAALVADMSYIAPGWPAVYTTLRGLCYAEIAVRTSKTDLHSGEYGGAAPNAHEELGRLLGRLKGADGKINIPGFYGPVKRPSKAELASWKKLPFNEKDFLNKRVQGKGLVGLKNASVLERLWALP